MGIQNSKEIMESYIKNKASIVVIVFDKESKIISYNKYAGEIIDKTKLEGGFFDVIVDFNNSFVKDDLKKLVKSGTKQLLTINTQNNSPISLFFEFFETIDGYVAIGEHNIIELEKKYIDFLHLSNELNNFSRELIKKRIELEKLNNLKNQFLGMAAHDLRNPASVISGYSSLLIDGRINAEKQKSFLEIIKISSDTILSLLNDLLDVSVIESGNLNLNLKETDFITLVVSNVELNRYFSDRKSINIVVKTTEKEIKLFIDPEKINQVLNNYLSNAIKYSKSNTTININLTKHNNEIIVSVKDEGVGIQKNDLPSLFQFFGKANSQTTAGESSTGLGLAIVKKIISEHKGNVWVESELGKGSIFYFSLPLIVK